MSTNWISKLLGVALIYSWALNMQAEAEMPLPVFSEEGLSVYVASKYKKDATRLALRLMSQNGNYATLEAKAPTNVVEGIYNALVGVHNSNDPMAKMVTRNHKLHTFPVPSVDRFFVVYNRGAEWAKPLRLGDDRTDNDQINGLIDEFNLKITKHVEWDEENNSFHVKAKESLNVAPIGQSISKVDGVKMVDLLMPDGDGNDIEIAKIADGYELNYMIKFDSCITGCKKKHVWTFHVTASGTKVKFIREFGDDLPPWMK